jgi:predicted PurR-regulated permease PerM
MRHFPLTVQRSIELLGLVLLGGLLVVGKAVIMPLLLAFFLSIVLLPVYRLFRALPEVLAITLSILLMMGIGLGSLYFFSIQVSKLVADLPQLKHNLLSHLHSLSQWLVQQTHYSTQQQAQFYQEQLHQRLNQAGTLLGQAALSLSSILLLLGLLPVYVFLLLYYKNILLQFVFLWFPPSQHQQVAASLRETESIIKGYLTGLSLEIALITGLLGGSLWLLGVKHAFLLGILLAFLNLIPYLGILLGLFLSLLITLASSPELKPLLTVFIAVSIVSFLDHNLLRPRIVGANVKINALVSLVGVIIGGHLAGIAGMFLSLPLIAILKLTFERTRLFAKWGVLLSDKRPAKSPLHNPSLRQ